MLDCKSIAHQRHLVPTVLRFLLIILQLASTMTPHLVSIGWDCGISGWFALLLSSFGPPPRYCVQRFIALFLEHLSS